MFKMLFSKKASGKGFTLIELLVVIAIIGILASIVLASLNTARRKSRDARRIADVKQLQLALELYFDANTTDGYADGLASLAPTYIPSVPTDPSGGSYDYDNYVNQAGGACVIADANACLFYHMGADIEESANTAIDGDRDGCTSVLADCTAPYIVGTIIDGRDGGGTTGNDCTGATTNVYCYDVTP